MTHIAVLAFLTGLGSAFFVPLLAFCLGSVAIAALAAILAANGAFPDIGALAAAVTAALAVQVGYAAGIALRSIINRFSDVRGAELAQASPDGLLFPRQRP